jgi:hypothetical protein
MIVGLVVGLVPANAPATTVQAQGGDPPTSFVYLPNIWYNPRRFVYLPIAEYRPTAVKENFTTDPEWSYALLKDPKDGFFEHSPTTGTYLGHIRDNSALMVTWPGWRARGDYKIEVDVRHVGPKKKSFNGLGIVFNATDNFDRFYAHMLAAGAAQHFWAVVDFKNTRAKYLTNSGYRGGTNFMRAWDNWNNFEVRVIDGEIHAYCNDKWLPGGSEPAKYLADDLLVGLVVTSYEFSNGEVEFDNFTLTPLFPGDPDYDEVIEMREARAALLGSDDGIEFDTPALDLHK